MPTEEFRDPANMSTEERLHIIEAYRTRMSAGEVLTVDEMRHAISCISADRASAFRERKRTSAEAKKASVRPMSLDDI
jgi:hypothetical protein